jgi:TRAP-type C4-dicarboxylate transport system permease small subunit
MYFLFSLIPATFIVVLGYFILFSTTKSERAVKTFSQILSIWVFVLAAFLPLAGAYATYAGLSPMESMMRSMHSRDG